MTTTRAVRYAALEKFEQLILRTKEALPKKAKDLDSELEVLRLWLRRNADHLTHFSNGTPRDDPERRARMRANMSASATYRWGGPRRFTLSYSSGKTDSSIEGYDQLAEYLDITSKTLQCKLSVGAGTIKCFRNGELITIVRHPRVSRDP